jgi:hypothetical protein
LKRPWAAEPAAFGGAAAPARRAWLAAKKNPVLTADGAPGRERVSPPPLPLRTVLASFPAHGSSKSFASRFLKVISRRAFLATAKLSLGLLLVAVQVYEFSVATSIRASPCSRYFVMAMKFLAIDEIHATESADPALVVRHVQIPGAQVFRIHLLPFPPVVP